MANIEQKVENLLKPKIEEIGYELYDVEYVKEGKNYFLLIYIDNEKGIDLNDCEKVNDAIMEPLDKADYIKEQYFLEVSSPGVERTLRKDEHLEKNIGKDVEIITGKVEEVIEKINNEKVEGTVIYTKSPKIGYRYINQVNAKNIFVNATLENMENVEESKDNMLIKKKIMYGMKDLLK